MCALVALGYVTASEKDLAIFLLVVAVGINSSTYLGFQVLKHKYTINLFKWPRHSNRKLFLIMGFIFFIAF